MTHPTAMPAGTPAAVGQRLRALLAALLARIERARRAAARRKTLETLESLGPDQLHDIGLRDGDLARLRRGGELRQ